MIRNRCIAAFVLAGCAGRAAADSSAFGETDRTRNLPNGSNGDRGYVGRRALRRRCRCGRLSVRAGAPAT